MVDIWRSSVSLIVLMFSTLQLAVRQWQESTRFVLIWLPLQITCSNRSYFHLSFTLNAHLPDWTLYDTAYTERYMDLPSLNVDGYQKSSALAKVQDIEGSLMLCHGLLDENVLFRQSAVLINKLIEHQKAYELQLFPSERHGPRRPQDRAFLEERILSFLQRSLNL